MCQLQLLGGTVLIADGGSLSQEPIANVESDPALVERVVEEGFRWLRFPAELERAFVEGRADDRTFRLILAGVNSAVVFNGMLPVDYVMLPGAFAWAVMLRLGLYGSFSVAAVYILYRMSFPGFNEWSACFFVALASGVVATLAMSGIHPLAHTQIVELLVIIVYVAVFMRFWPMVLAAAIVLIVHMWVIMQSPAFNSSLRIGSTLMLMTTISFALHSCYVREHNDRLSFLKGLRERALRQSLNDANTRLDALARTDALTGIANRRAFDDFLAQQLREAHRPNKRIALLLVDVDHFKAFNDLYGHDAGDRCLRLVADAISPCLRRPVDMLARWGGEEFAVVLGDADLEAARHVSERVRQAVAAQCLIHAGSTCADILTVSIGVAVLGGAVHGVSSSELIEQADQALYQAKAQGRNRAIVTELKVGAAA